MLILWNVFQDYIEAHKVQLIHFLSDFDLYTCHTRLITGRRKESNRTTFLSHTLDTLSAIMENFDTVLEAMKSIR